MFLATQPDDRSSFSVSLYGLYSSMIVDTTGGGARWAVYFLTRAVKVINTVAAVWSDLREGVLRKLAREYVRLTCRVLCAKRSYGVSYVNVRVNSSAGLPGDRSEGVYVVDLFSVDCVGFFYSVHGCMLTPITSVVKDFSNIWITCNAQALSS